VGSGCAESASRDRVPSSEALQATCRSKTLGLRPLAWRGAWWGRGGVVHVW
jgi:hypothetical protein